MRISPGSKKNDKNPWATRICEYSEIALIVEGKTMFGDTKSDSHTGQYKQINRTAYPLRADDIRLCYLDLSSTSILCMTTENGEMLEA